MGDDQAMDAIELLEAQHRGVERLFADLAREDGDRRALLVGLADLLTAHATIEERHFYPTFRGVETRTLVEDAFDDHREVKQMVVHLLDVGPLDERFAAELAELQDRVNEHVAAEETDLFPRARDALDDDELEAMAQEMTATLAELEEEGPLHEQLRLELGESPR
jgi:hemerythrin superfamily protein